MRDLLVALLMSKATIRGLRSLRSASMSWIRLAVPQAPVHVHGIVAPAAVVSFAPSDR
ncbi:hypothetical protein [Actinoplanes nipponensis]|uniref:hypothetical protein n=1 Tax=Actinoplanes nipponensis TaxID=135950 RepID=UPI0031EECF9D